jgi:hypothetical protein
MYLDALELFALTGRRHSHAQAAYLQRMGLPFQRKPDGKVLMLRSDAPAKLIQPKREAA